mmetsp:Transcript_310/g.1211  ORF Transcript_310/g.1211 Transcript_310/m.1211 type:complete len:234 (-) Transcript_310:41-742(-)
MEQCGQQHEIINVSQHPSSMLCSSRIDRRLSHAARMMHATWFLRPCSSWWLPPAKVKYRHQKQLNVFAQPRCAMIWRDAWHCQQQIDSRHPSPHSHSSVAHLRRGGGWIPCASIKWRSIAGGADAIGHQHAPLPQHPSRPSATKLQYLQRCAPGVWFWKLKGSMSVKCFVVHPWPPSYQCGGTFGPVPGRIPQQHGSKYPRMLLAGLCSPPEKKGRARSSVCITMAVVGPTAS